MIEDGALEGRKLLVIPNSSVTVTSRKAVDAMRRWVSAGGTLVGFGPGCLALTVEPDRSLRPTPGLAGMIPVGDLTTARRAKQAAVPTAWKQKQGTGRAVLYLSPADPAKRTTSGKSLAEEATPYLVDEAWRAGIRLWCHATPERQINVIYCGRDCNSGRHLFVADLTR